MPYRYERDQRTLHGNAPSPAYLPLAGPCNQDRSLPVEVYGHTGLPAAHGETLFPNAYMMLPPQLLHSRPAPLLSVPAAPLEARYEREDSIERMAAANEVCSEDEVETEEDGQQENEHWGTEERAEADASMKDAATVRALLPNLSQQPPPAGRSAPQKLTYENSKTLVNLCLEKRAGY